MAHEKNMNLTYQTRVFAERVFLLKGKKNNNKTTNIPNLDINLCNGRVILGVVYNHVLMAIPLMGGCYLRLSCHYLFFPPNINISA